MYGGMGDASNTWASCTNENPLARTTHSLARPSLEFCPSEKFFVKWNIFPAKRNEHECSWYSQAEAKPSARKLAIYAIHTHKHP